MLAIGRALRTEYERKLVERKVAKNVRTRHLKWLRYYLDFCSKYHHQPVNPASLPKFINKLREKRQTSFQQAEAAHVVRLYFDLQRSGSVENSLRRQNADRCSQNTPANADAHFSHKNSAIPPKSGSLQQQYSNRSQYPTLIRNNYLNIRQVASSS